MTEQSPNTIDIPDTHSVLAEADAILAGNSAETTPEQYATIFDELCERALLPMTEDERQKLNQAMEDVRWAWWQAKRRQGNGAAAFRKAKMHSSEIH